MERHIIQDCVRNQIYDEEEFKRPIIFTGMEDGVRGLTDIDSIYEYKNQGWLIFEVKRKGAGLKEGQMVLLNRFVESMTRDNKLAYAFIVEHEQNDTSKPIILALCKPVLVYSNYDARLYANKRMNWLDKWRPLETEMTPVQIKNWFIDACERRIQRKYARIPSNFASA